MYMETKIIYSKTKTVAQYSSSFLKKKKTYFFMYFQKIDSNDNEDGNSNIEYI